MAVNLNPEIGTRLAAALTSTLDNAVQESTQQMWDAVRSLGDDANMTEQLKQKLLNLQKQYNEEVVPALSACKAGFEEFTDMSEHIAKYQMDTSVKATDADVGSVGTGLFDAAKNL